MRLREAVAHEEVSPVSRRVRPGRDAHTEPSRLHRGAQRNISIEPRPWTETVQPARAPPRRRARGNRATDAVARDGRNEKDSAVACKVLCVATPDVKAVTVAPTSRCHLMTWARRGLDMAECNASPVVDATCCVDYTVPTQAVAQMQQL